jgi:threonine dehydratase
MWEQMKIVIEPSCALTLAALIANKEKFQGQKLVLIITGGNVDLTNLPW